MFFSGLGLGFNRVKNTIIIIFYCNIFIQKKTWELATIPLWHIQLVESRNQKLKNSNRVAAV